MIPDEAVKLDKTPKKPLKTASHNMRSTSWQYKHGEEIANTSNKKNPNLDPLSKLGHPNLKSHFTTTSTVFHPDPYRLQKNITQKTNNILEAFKQA